MATKKVMLEEVSNDLFLINSNSSLVEIISFSYSLHTLAVESGMCDNDDWYDFAFSMHLKVSDSYDDVMVISEQEVLILSEWLDWICRLIVESSGEHISTKFMKTFLMDCDCLFSQAKTLREKERIITEKVKKKA